MKKLLAMLLLPLGTVMGQTPAVDISLMVSDGIASKELRFGIDGTATEGIDRTLGEAELPPPPPSGVFDARFSGFNIGIDLGQGSLRDYREGWTTEGGTRIHEVRYQVGSGNSISIAWELPSGVTGRIEDFLGGVVINQPMAGSGNVTVSNPGALPSLKMTVEYEPTVSVAGPERQPLERSLLQAYPNPFNPETEIEFSVPLRGTARLVVYDIHGRTVAVLFDQTAMPGVEYRAKFRGEGVSSGIYLCRLECEGVFKALRLLMMK